MYSRASINCRENWEEEEEEEKITRILNLKLFLE